MFNADAGRRRQTYDGGVFEVDWGSVSVIGGLVAGSFGYLSRQMHRVEDKLTVQMGGLENGVNGRMDRLEGRIDRLEEKLNNHVGRLEGKVDKLTERYIEHLERRH